ncbi:MAG: LamG-like jellyroll fold domain-containing protein [Sedimentisphaerales bacterium]
MFHQSSKQILLGTFVALLLITMPVYAVKSFKVSTYGAGHQIWFEVEDFDERDPDDDSSFALSDEPGAFGRSISSVSGSDGASMISYTFDISKAGGKGGTWYFWGRVINPSNQSDFMLVESHPGDASFFPITLPVTGLISPGQRMFEENAGSPGNWAWSGDNHNEAHTKTLQDGENTMYILARQSGAIWDVFMWTDDPDYVPTDEDYINAVIFVPNKATNPSPADGAIDVPRDVTLSWTPGDYADKHDVYFGTNFNDVNDASRTNPLGVLVSQNQVPNSYSPAEILQWQQTYYWRIDEVNAPPDFTIFKGAVWSFTTEPFAYPIASTSIAATASSQFNTDTGPEKTIDGSGLDADDLHSTEEAALWISSMTGPQPSWIQYEFDRVYKLHEMQVWNYNASIELILGFGIKDATIEHSVDGVTWTTLATVEFARAPGAPGYAANTTVDFTGVVAKYVKITANSNWGGVLPQYGLSEVRFLYVPVVAREPDPASGATDMAVDNVTLSWRAGRQAASHNVYLSSDEQAVIDETVSAASIPAGSSYANYNTGPLDLGQAYYWKVNEVNEAETPTTWQGDVWNFSTQEYLVVDDFEDYNDFEPDRIFDTWIDGWNVPTNGSQVGSDVPPFAEQAIVHDGKQSMPLHYDNSTASYSEATVNVANLPVGQDWTKHGIKTLSLWFYGDPSNAPEQMYVKLNGSKVAYDGDAANITRVGWQPWNIELSAFGGLGVNLSNITELGIGFERSGAVGGSGVVYFDDVRLYPYERQFITPAEPNAAGLMAHWKLDEGSGTIAADSSGNGLDGTLVGVPLWVAGNIGGALEFDGVDDHVDCGNSPILDFGTGDWTVSAWIKVTTTPSGDVTIFGKGGDHTSAILPGVRYQLMLDSDNDIHPVVDDDSTKYDPRGDIPVIDGQWHHIVMMRRDGTKFRVYVDGVEDMGVTNHGESTLPANYDLSGTSKFNAYIGAITNAEVSTPDTVVLEKLFLGMIDDVRVYDYALSDAEIAWLAGRTKPFDKPF